MSIARGVLLLSLVGALSGCSLVEDPPAAPLDALRTLCGDEVVAEERDPAPTDGYNQETDGEGRQEYLATETCPDMGNGDDGVYAARYDRDPTDDMIDNHQAYSEADGSQVTWAIAEGGGEWTVVWSARSAVSEYAPLAERGFDVVDGNDADAG